MRALVWHGGAEPALEELPGPAPGAGEVVLDIRLAGICGSDLHACRGHGGPRRPPLVLGHGWVEVMPLAAGQDAFARLAASPPCATTILLEAG